MLPQRLPVWELILFSEAQEILRVFGAWANRSVAGVALLSAAMCLFRKPHVHTTGILCFTKAKFLDGLSFSLALEQERAHLGRDPPLPPPKPSSPAPSPAAQQRRSGQTVSAQGAAVRGAGGLY